MNSTANGRPVIPRTGYIVEINALWYNALRFTSELLSEGGNNNLADALNVLAEKTGKAFVDTFLNEYGYLLDYVDGNDDGLERASEHDIYCSIRLFSA